MAADSIETSGGAITLPSGSTCRGSATALHSVTILTNYTKCGFHTFGEGVDVLSGKRSHRHELNEREGLTHRGRTIKNKHANT